MLCKNEDKAHKKSHWNLARLIPLISKHLPTLNTLDDFKTMCELLRNLALYSIRFLAVSNRCMLAQAIAPYLDYEREMSAPGDTECRSTLAQTFIVLLPNDISTSFEPFVVRQHLIRILPSIILKETSWSCSAAGLFLRFLDCCDKEDFRVACTWPETLTVLAQFVINPALYPYLDVVTDSLLAAIALGPRLHHPHLNDSYHDALSHNPYFDYLYAHVLEDLRRINLAARDHPTLPLLAFLEWNGGISSKISSSSISPH